MTPALKEHEPRTIEQAIATYENAARYHAHNGRRNMAEENRAKAERLRKQLEARGA